MNPPEKFLIAMILVGYGAAEIMLAQHGATALEMGAALVVAVVLLLYVYLKSRRGAAAGPDAASACSSCSSSSCSSCASGPGNQAPRTPQR